jgi:hypothetical protein
MSEGDLDRVAQFRKLIRLDESEGTIDLNELHRFLLLPFPDGHPELRFYNWQLSLRVLPPQRELWDRTWKVRTEQYHGLVRKIFRNVPDFLDSGLQGGRFIECAKMMQAIHKDVPRMPKISRELLTVCKGDSVKCDRHFRRIERLVFVFSFVNTKCTYTQGFHELSAPLYYMVLLAAQTLGLSDDDVEAISFFLLFNLVIGTNLYTVFTTLGAIEEIEGRFSKIITAVRLCDSHFADYLFTELAIQPLHFSFPWVSLLFAQSLEVQDLLHLWDHLLVFNEEIVDFLMLLSAAYLLFRKKALMRMDFDNVMSELHNTKEMNFMTLLRIAHQLKDQLDENGHGKL